jgi:competence protein ComEC
VTGIFVGLALLLGAGAGWAGVVACTGIALTALLGGGRRLAWTMALVPAAVVGCLRAYDSEALTIPPLPAGEASFLGRVDSGPVEGGRTRRFDLVIEQPDGRQEVRLCVIAPLVPSIGFGDEVRVSGDVRWLDETEEQLTGFLRSRGCVGSLRADELAVVEPGHGIHAWLDQARRSITESLHRAAPGDTGALLTGLVTGDDSALPNDRREAFTVTGTSHITAVSGSNLAVIVAILALTGAAVGFGRAWPWQALTVAALWLYVGVIGPSPPPLRAAMVASFAVVALWLGRRPDFVTLSVVVAALELVWRPGDFDSLAFRLSTVSTVALVLGLAGRTPLGWRGWLSHGVFATATTQAATSPLLIPVFGRMSLYAIPANLIIGPVCAFAFPIALIAGLVGVFSSTLGAAVAAPAMVPAYLALQSASFFAGLAGAEAGSELGLAVPGWVWLFLGVAAVMTLSKECRGGIKRVAKTVIDVDDRTRILLASSSVGAVVGVAAGFWLR